ncbi:MAG: TetR/AcrR family transcriptional regulator [Cryobacterium sp.]
MSDLPLPSASRSAARPVSLESRTDVGDIAVRLFHERGYDATSATEIARAAGLSRSTFFRQFHSKDDVIFADHEELLAQISVFFEATHPDPWTAVCDAAIMVFERFHDRLDIVRLRDLVLRDNENLRDRETVMVSRYEKTFAAYLRRVEPEHGALPAIRYAAAITATHNYELRRLIRSETPFDPRVLAAELADIRRLLGPIDPGQTRSSGTTGSDLVVAVFPATTSPAQIARAIENTLRNR